MPTFQNIPLYVDSPLFLMLPLETQYAFSIHCERHNSGLEKWKAQMFT